VSDRLVGGQQQIQEVEGGNCDDDVDDENMACCSDSTQECPSP
jgi:hypothetical protein